MESTKLRLVSGAELLLHAMRHSSNILLLDHIRKKVIGQLIIIHRVGCNHWDYFVFVYF
jgi:hypothetical protein